MELSKQQLLPVLIIEAAGEVCGKTRLQKLVFLAQQEYGDELYSFEDYAYGPYSRILQVEMDMLEDQDVVKVQRSISISGDTTPTYSIPSDTTISEEVTELAIGEAARKVVDEYGDETIRSLVDIVGEFDGYSTVFY